MLQLFIFLVLSILLWDGAPQTITFYPLPDKILGSSPFPVGAKATSGLAVTLNSSTPAVCRITGGIVTLVASGTCALSASQGGSSVYLAAPLIVRSFTVTPAKPSGTLSHFRGSPMAVGLNPYAVVVADFNRDGWDDILTMNGSPSSATVFLNDGTGGWTQAVGSPFQIGNGAVSVVAGDWNGDGFPDLAVASASPGSVSIWFGNGAGGFNPSSSGVILTGSSSIPQAIATADFNGDGILDLAVADRGNNAVLLLLGNGTGRFTAAAGSPYALGNGNNGPVALALGDFNGDGYLDIATANQVSGTVSLLLGRSSGGFALSLAGNIRIGNQPFSMVTGDVNGDGILDLVTANNAGNSISILLGNGAGLFTASTGSPVTVTSPWAVAIADWNGDGKADLAVAAAGSGVSIWLGNGNGAFRSAGITPFGGATNATALAVGDFDHDSAPDLVAANYDGGNVAVLAGRSAATVAVLSTTASFPLPFGQPLPLTLTVTNTGNAYTPPGGSASFFDGQVQLGDATQTASPYSFSATNLGGGSHSVTGNYNGDARNMPAASAALAFQVTGAPAAAITSVSPANVTAGGPAFVLYLNGTGFVSGALAMWNKTPLLTQFTSPIMLTAAVPASLISAAGSATITVVNPGATASNSANVTILTLSISALSPATSPIGGASLTLCATGTAFQLGAVMFWNGEPVSTSLVSATQVCGTIPGALLTTAGSFDIVVANVDGTSSKPFPFTLTPPAPPPPPIPVVSPGGIGPLYSSNSTIQPGSWFSIYGTNLAASNLLWSGDFPLSLGGTSVTVNGKPAYLWSVGPTQINAQAPDDSTIGKVNVVVTTATGKVTAPVTLAAVSPSFSLFPGGLYAAGVIVTPDGSGAYANGAYDLLGPVGRFPFATRPVRAGESLVLYGVGFGATKPTVPAGKPYSGAAPTVGEVKVTIGGVSAKVAFAGITSAGLYQMNVVVPAIPPGDQVISASAGTTATQPGVLVSVK